MDESSKDLGGTEADGGAVLGKRKLDKPGKEKINEKLNWAHGTEWKIWNLRNKRSKTDKQA